MSDISLERTQSRWFNVREKQGQPTIYALGEYLGEPGAKFYRVTIFCGQPDGSFQRYGLQSRASENLADASLWDDKALALIKRLLADQVQVREQIKAQGMATASISDPWFYDGAFIRPAPSVVLKNPG